MKISLGTAFYLSNAKAYVLLISSISGICYKPQQLKGKKNLECKFRIAPTNFAIHII